MLLPLLLLIAACSDKAADPLSRAEQALDDDEPELAQQLADSLVSGTGFNKLYTTQLCRTALLYSKLSEKREQDANMAMAALCMRAASERGADSVQIFIDGLSVDDKALIDMPRKLSGVNHYSPVPDESAADSIEMVEPADSLN